MNRAASVKFLTLVFSHWDVHHLLGFWFELEDFFQVHSSIHVVSMTENRQYYFDPEMFCDFISDLCIAMQCIGMDPCACWH